MSVTSGSQTTGSSKYMIKSRTVKVIKIHLNIWRGRLPQRSSKQPWKLWRARSLLALTKLPMRCWNTLAPKQSPNSWEYSITAGRQGMSLGVGKNLTWYPSTNKKGKDCVNRYSYYPISLTGYVSKLMERLTNACLAWHMEKNNIITPEQAGFRQHRSTEDKVTYIAQKIKDCFQDKQHTLTVSVDMEKTDNKVWKDGLCLKLQKSHVTGCIHVPVISKYLTNTKAWVHVNRTYSQKKTLREGVPQGGIFSPTLFLVFANYGIIRPAS